MATASQEGARRTALVSGASSGIGRELAHLAAADGFDLVIVGRDRTKLDELKDELEAAHHVPVRSESLDLSEPHAAARLWATLTGAEIAVDMLINNAGSGLYGDVAEQDAEALERMLHVNVVALTTLTRLALPGMKTRRFGRILNVGSIVGHQPAGPRMAGYYASKAYVVSFSKGLARELEGTGVSVTVLSPGPTQSAFEERSGAGRSRIYNLFPMMPAAAVARAGYVGMKRQSTEVIPGVLAKVLALAGELSPPWIGVAVNRFLLSEASVDRSVDPKNAPGIRL